MAKAVVRWGVGALVVAATSTACALLVGNVNGYDLFDGGVPSDAAAGHEAGKARLDAGASESGTTGHPPEAGAGDAPPDALATIGYDAGTCTIDGVTYAAYAVDPTSLCFKCIPAQNTVNWTSIQGRCGADAGGCTIHGVAAAANNANPANGCQECAPATSNTAWSPVAEGAGCGTGKCENGHCVCSTQGVCLHDNVCDTTFDDLNCTGCGKACPAGTICAANACVSPPHLSVARTNLAVTPASTYSSEGTLAVIGGRASDGPVASVEYINAQSNFVAPGADLGLARFGAAASVDNLNIFVAGGSVSGDGGFVPTAEVEYTPTSLQGTWSAVANGLPFPVAGAAAVSSYARGYPLLFGGTTMTGVTAGVEAWDAGPPSAWTIASPSLPSPRSGATALASCCSLYVVGGVDDAGAPAAALLMLSESGTWSQQPIQPWPNPRAGASAAFDNVGRIYVIGGLNGDGTYSDEVDIYSPYSTSNNWSTGPPLPTARTGLACSLLPGVNRIYCVGGYNGQYLTTVEAYSIALGAWAE